MMGGLGNLPLKRLQKQRDDLIDRYERLGPDSRLYDQQRDELLEAIEEVERQIRELDPPPPPPPAEVFDLDDPAARKAALAKWGQRHVESVPDLPPDVHEMSGEPGRIGRAHPERQPPPYEPAPPLTEEQKKLNREEIEKTRKEHGLNMEMNQAIQAAIMAAAAGGALRTFGGGGILGGLGGGMSLR